MVFTKFNFKGIKISDGDTILIETVADSDRDSEELRTLLQTFIAKNNIKRVDIKTRHFYTYREEDFKYNVSVLSANSLDMAFETNVLESK